ncbi:MAG: hypothetical protein ABIZ80_18170 [Bryobacteraceae bacterium]
MPFDPTAYGPDISGIFALDGNGERLMPLASGLCSSGDARALLLSRDPGEWFPRARHAEAALSGLLLYFSCLDESHEMSQRLKTIEGGYWHGIMHRQEPDRGNAAYWFRQVRSHAIHAPLAEAARVIAGAFPEAGVSLPAVWDAVRFVDICEQARRRPGSALEAFALRLQRAEWQLLFDHCARGGGSVS